MADAQAGAIPQAELPEVLRAFDRLEVGPVELSPNKLVMPYAIIRGDERDRTELVYRYDEDVFDPTEPESVALASMIGAQVALNYSLFCDEIRLHGPFSQADRNLLRDMAENTAREIYVKKLLEPGPFLVGEAAKMPLVIARRYSGPS